MRKYVSIEYHPMDSRIRMAYDDEFVYRESSWRLPNSFEGGVVQTLNERMGTGGGNVPLILEIYEDEDIDGEEIL